MGLIASTDRKHLSLTVVCLKTMVLSVRLVVLALARWVICSVRYQVLLLAQPPALSAPRLKRHPQ